MIEEIKTYSYLWDGSEAGWVLLRYDRDPSQLSILNELGSFTVVIENDDVHAAVMKAMLAAGVPIREPHEFIPRELEVHPRSGGPRKR